MRYFRITIYGKIFALRGDAVVWYNVCKERDMKKINKLTVALVAVLASATLTGCAVRSKGEEGYIPPAEEREESGTPTPPETVLPEIPEISMPEQPTRKTSTYICVTGEGVNLRSGAGTDYSSRGTAEKATLYAYSGESGSWLKTEYRGSSAYIHGKYCEKVTLNSSGNELIERVISEGCKLLGTPYVYGATRLHDGKGNMLKGFTANAFDCSSLMQYIFYKGADKLLEVNTRTQIYQGKTVSKSELERGDLMFFTNSSRKNLSGVERIGHVALYLGDNYILHTASDYAKIERISQARWGYFIQAQRIIT